MWAETLWQEIRDTIGNNLPGFVEAVGRGLLVFAVFWIVAVATRRISVRLAEARGVEPGFTRFLGRAVRTTILAFGVVTALGMGGIDISALVAGLGLTGFALGFALKDIISNVLAGVLINLYKPFRQGDSIKVSSFQGKVSAIDLRYTVLEDEGRQIFVPNSMLFTNAITVETSVE